MCRGDEPIFNPKDILKSFKRAYEDKNSFSYLFIENGDFYNQK